MNLKNKLEASYMKNNKAQFPANQTLKNKTKKQLIDERI
jgi:hypothetical protein